MLLYFCIGKIVLYILYVSDIKRRLLTESVLRSLHFAGENLFKHFYLISKHKSTYKKQNYRAYNNIKIH